MLGARVLAEFADDTARCAHAKVGRNYAGRRPSRGPQEPCQWSWPATQETTDSATPSNSGPSERPAAPLERVLTTTPCEPARLGTQAALRQLANHLVWILHD